MGSIRNITFSKVVVANTGGGGLFLDRCTGCAVLDSEVYGVGTTAIQISGGGHRTLRRSDNLVQNCSIHHFARCKPRHDIVAFFHECQQYRCGQGYAPTSRA